MKSTFLLGLFCLAVSMSATATIGFAQQEADEGGPFRFNRVTFDSQRAFVERVVFYELMNSPDLTLAYEHYFPGKLKL